MITRSFGRTVAVLTTSLTLVTAPVVFAGSALAAEPTSPVAAVNNDGDTVFYRGGNVANNLTMGLIQVPDSANLYYVVLRDRVDIRTGFNCRYANKANHKTVYCIASFEGTTPSTLNVDLGAGNDTATAAKGLFLGTAVHGGSGNDRLTGADQDIALYGDAGDDTINGGSGRDSLYGGPGKDLIKGGPGTDTIYGNSGNDTIYGNSGNDTISGGPGKDKISGGPGRNKIKQ